jgi:hypothetical protein
MEGKEQEKIERKALTVFTGYAQFFHRLNTAHFSRKTTCFFLIRCSKNSRDYVFTFSILIFHYSTNRICHACPAAMLIGKSFRSLSSQPIELGASVVFRWPLFNCDPLSQFQSMQRWVQRALLYAQRAAARSMDRFRDRGTVNCPACDGFQDQHRQRARNDLRGGTVRFLSIVFHKLFMGA